jgi:hypothetical protein
MGVARQAGELMRQRWRELRAALAATIDSLTWAPELGPRPSEPDDDSAWLTAATAVTAYRERYDVPEHTAMIGPRPAASRPDAQAAWDHACLQGDRYLARRLAHLDDQQLTDLDARQQSILDNPPPFDPSELEGARHALAAPGSPVTAVSHQHGEGATRERLLVQRLERAAQAHRVWRRTAFDARAIRRQVALENARRQRHLAPLRRA